MYQKDLVNKKTVANYLKSCGVVTAKVLSTHLRHSQGSDV